MRVTSAIFIGALVRRAQAEGGFATILHRGAEDAGAIHIVLRNRHGEQTLFSPAMGGGSGEERAFAIRATSQSDAEIAAVLDRELKFDSDCWAVEIEGDFDELPFDVIAD
ncbi:MAG: DUF1491 family protein [Pseudomonadota bacterium]